MWEGRGREEGRREGQFRNMGAKIKKKKTSSGSTQHASYPRTVAHRKKAIDFFKHGPPHVYIVLLPFSVRSEFLVFGEAKMGPQHFLNVTEGRFGRG